MSFSDLERGEARRSVPLAFKGDGLKALADKISMQIFKINSNVAGISKLVDLLGSNRDSHDIRSKLHDLTEATRILVKNSTADVKSLAKWDLSSADPDEAQRLEMKKVKVSQDFQRAIASFQSIQKLSADRQRRFIQTAIPSQELPQQRYRDDGDEAPSHQLQSQQQLNLVPDSELEYQEQLIEEREGEIRQIESGIQELNEIFQDLGNIVTGQQSMLDNIESNVYSIANDTEGASTELTSAHHYQKRAGRRMLCLLMIFIIVLAVVLLAVLS